MAVFMDAARAPSLSKPRQPTPTPTTNNILPAAGRDNRILPERRFKPSRVTAPTYCPPDYHSLLSGRHKPVPCKLPIIGINDSCLTR